MTDHQVTTHLRIAQDLAAFWHWPDIQAAQREHNQFQATACPSGRYARFYAALAAGEDAMTPEEAARLKAVEDKLAQYDKYLAWRFTEGEKAAKALANAFDLTKGPPDG